MPFLSDTGNRALDQKRQDTHSASDQAHSLGSIISANLQHNVITSGRDTIINIGVSGGLGNEGTQQLKFEDKRKLADWLSPLNYRQFHKDIFDKVATGTGSWILERPEFMSWLAGEIKTFWGVGMPGAGKTCLTSFVMHHLVSKMHATVICIYCQYKDQLLVEDILACLLKQLVESSDEVASYVWSSLYKECCQTATRPSKSELLTTIRDGVSKLDSNLFLLVDALDELKDVVCSELVAALISLSLPLFMTSRPYIKLSVARPIITLAAPDDVLLNFVSMRVSAMAWLDSFLNAPGVRDEVVQKICEKCNGMFLLATLQLDTLAIGDITDIPTLRQAINNLPISLNSQYQLIWNQIQGQGQAQRRLAHQALQIIAHATRSLYVEELLEALTVDLSTTSVNQEISTTEETLLRISFGFLTVVHSQTESKNQGNNSPKGRIIQLIHYSAQAYLEDMHFPAGESNTYIANISAVYLICNSLRCQLTTMISVDELKNSQNLLEYPFLLYACQFISSHTYRAFSESNNVLPVHLAQLFQRQLTLPIFLNPLGSSAPADFLDHVQACHFAALYGLDFLLEETPGTIVNSALGCTPLFYACLGGQTSLAKKIIEGPNARQQIEQPTYFGSTVLHAAFSSGNSVIAKDLLLVNNCKLDINARTLTGATVIHLASVYNHPAVIQEFLNYLEAHNPGQIITLLNSKNRQGRTPLHSAAFHGYQAVAAVLLSSPSILVNAEDNEKWTPLHFAVRNNHWAVVQLLLAAPDIQPNAKTVDQYTPLYFAVKCDYQPIVQLLLASSSISVNAKDHDGFTPLHHAIVHGHLAIVRLLLASPDISVNTQDNEGWTPLHMAAGSNQEAVIHLLLATPGINPNAGNNKNQWTPLHLATFFGYCLCTQALLASSKGSVNAKDLHKRTPLHHAASNGHHAVVQLLLSSPSINLNAEDMDKWTPLHFAACYNHPEVVRLLLAFPGVDINTETNSKETPLYIAARDGHSEVAQLLVTCPGINVNATTGTKGTPLHIAAFNGHQAVVEVLLDAPGIKVNAMSICNETPYDWAMESGNDEIAELLKPHGTSGSTTNASPEDRCVIA